MENICAVSKFMACNLRYDIFKFSRLHVQLNAFSRKDWNAFFKIFVLSPSNFLWSRSLISEFREHDSELILKWF